MEKGKCGKRNSKKPEIRNEIKYQKRNPQRTGENFNGKKLWKGK